jgi:hypothetical protein
MVLAIAAFALNASQAARDREQQERQAAQEQRSSIEEARERSLGAYLDRMSDLILRGDLPDRSARSTSTAPSDSQTLARTLTLVVLRRLDGGRKAVVLQFLWEAGLIRQTQRWIRIAGAPEWGYLYRSRLPIVNLENADLRGVDLSGNRLAAFGAPFGATIVGHPPEGVSYQFRQGVDLTGTDLRGADLSEANLSNASFLEADLRGAILAKHEGAPAANLKATGGHDVDFRGADLDYVGLQASRLKDVRLEGASTREASLPLSLEFPDLPRSRFEPASRCDPPRMW